MYFINIVCFMTLAVENAQIIHVHILNTWITGFVPSLHAGKLTLLSATGSKAKNIIGQLLEECLYTVLCVYICVCMCVCVWQHREIRERQKGRLFTYVHTDSHVSVQFAKPHHVFTVYTYCVLTS